MGLGPGHHVLLHSSLSSLGWVEGGPATVVEALLEVVGPAGTLLAPTITATPALMPGARFTFDAVAEPGWTGTIAETVRTWPGAIRSLHPTHSVAALGAAAERFTAGHEDSITPCGVDSPYRRLADDPDGRILLLGCDHQSNTTLHAVEEMAAASYHLHPTPAHATIRAAGRVLERTLWIHRWGTPRQFNAIAHLLVERGAQVDGRVGAASAHLLSAAAVVSIGTAALAADAAFFLGRPAEPAF